MWLRRCAFCAAVIGACWHKALQPIARPDDDEPPPPNPVHFVINAPTVANSTSLRAVLPGRTLFLSTGPT